MNRRSSGILMHISSLPSKYGIGDLGPESYKFADYLARTKQSCWQVLPLSPTAVIMGNSPYSSSSAFAGNPLLISPELLHKEGLLNYSDAADVPLYSPEKVDYAAVTTSKQIMFEKAYQKFKEKGYNRDYERFCARNSFWLDDFAAFTVIKACFYGCIWSDWPTEYRDRQSSTLCQIKEQSGDALEKEKFLQFVFYSQWEQLKQYVNHLGIQILGDIPIYVSYDSADVWANPGIFKLDYNKKPLAVAGVPPDYFSSTGQLWGNPVYDWNALQSSRYSWWIDRIRHNLAMFDLLRIDHYRGLVAYWEVPVGEKTAINGKWVDVPAEDFFSVIYKFFPVLPVIAEDLGIITPDVHEIMSKHSIPGMRILLFAFGDDNPNHPYLPHNYPTNCLAYTGTHDNNTVRGWFETEASEHDKNRIYSYVGKTFSVEEVSWELIRLAMRSSAGLVITPMQDILSLGSVARMNTPSTSSGNWSWRLLPGQGAGLIADKLSELTYIYGRE